MVVPLPPLLLLTDRAQASSRQRTLLEVLQRAVAAGARAVVVRERDLPGPERAELVGRVQALLVEVAGTVIVAPPAVGPGSAVHLRAGEPVPPGAAPPVGRSCHGPRELGAAASDGCDYATLSPIFPTPSKPGYGPALGPDALADAPLPTFALGGVTAGRAAACVAAGAAGVAVMGGVMAAADPGRAVTDLLAALGGAP
jgi:thiamine-phosphate pyrophosphorylase